MEDYSKINELNKSTKKISNELIRDTIGLTIMKARQTNLSHEKIQEEMLEILEPAMHKEDSE